MKWPSFGASLEVSVVIMSKGNWEGECLLDERRVAEITSYLTSGEELGPPDRLAQNQGLSFIGVTLLGDGFLFSPEIANEIISRDERYRILFRPFLNGKDFNSTPDFRPSRFVPDFGDMNEAKASEFAEVFNHLRNTVAVQRSKLHRQIHETCFWKFWDKRKTLQEKLAGQSKVIVRALTSKHFAFGTIPSSYVIDQTLLVFPNLAIFPYLQSSLHEVWSLQYGATLETRPRYSLSDCFQTFPFPYYDTPSSTSSSSVALADVASTYQQVRRSLMEALSLGLTDVYNRFHDSDVASDDIQKLRQLHVEMDNAVAAAYGWTDLELEHGFHETKQGVRYTISEPARREVLARLLKLNHERYAEEVKQGLHEKKKGSAKKPTTKKPDAKPVKDTATLFDMQEDDE
jgi:hypothetical protein